jgi:hypothetical protein
VQLLNKLLARRPEERFQTAAEAALALEALAHGDAYVASGREPALQAATDASVPESAPTTGAEPKAHVATSPACEPPRPTSNPWLRAGSLLSQQPRVIVFSILLFELILVGIAFSLGYLFAIGLGSRGR